MMSKETKHWYRSEYLASSHWKTMRRRVYIIWGYKCSILGCKRLRISPHHLSYQHIGTDREFNDLRPLCRLHHFLAHWKIFSFKKIALNRAALTKRYYEIKRTTWKHIRPSDIMNL
jgi:hypothetical protein